MNVTTKVVKEEVHNEKEVVCDSNIKMPLPLKTILRFAEKAHYASFHKSYKSHISLFLSTENMSRFPRQDYYDSFSPASCMWTTMMFTPSTMSRRLDISLEMLKLSSWNAQLFLVCLLLAIDSERPFLARLHSLLLGKTFASLR
uniref:Uncharacterized protein n=1 Tax=Cucumis melo TaxID=3656 RepID=A0A9I9EGW0_CUCME